MIRRSLLLNKKDVEKCKIYGSLPDNFMEILIREYSTGARTFKPLGKEKKEDLYRLRLACSEPIWNFAKEEAFKVTGKRSCSLFLRGLLK